MQPTVYTPTQLPDRIARKIRVDPESGCWVWTAALNECGYGVMSWQGKTPKAHRLVYSLLVRDPGPVLDHICFNPACVNPEHLRPVTHKQNQEHRSGARRDSHSGVRGVIWSEKEGRWRVAVVHNKKNYYGGRFDDPKQAELVAIALRAKLFTHDDGGITS